MKELYYIGLDVHKKHVSYVIKTSTGQLAGSGEVEATRAALSEWARAIDRPWIAALEATLFSSWIYDHLLPLAEQIQVAHPAMLEAITCSKKKNDRLDADKICDLLRCELLPQCYLAPREIRELRRVLRYRNLLVREAVRMKNKISGLLMEVGEPYNAAKLHRKKYFYPYLDTLQDTPESVKELLLISRTSLELFARLQRRLLKGLERHPLLKQRVERLQSIRGVGEVLALSWALEIAEVKRFSSLAQAVSYCGLCAAQRESGGKSYRGPLSKQRNKHLQRALIEVAKLAPHYNPRLRQVRDRELDRGHRNRATLAVARKLVAYLLAVDRSGQPFVEESQAA
jgi:transposase